MKLSNKEKLNTIWDKTKGHCHFCGEKLIFENYAKSKFIAGNWYVDHIFPRALGGDSMTANYLPICGECNRLKWFGTGKKIQELMKYGFISLREIKKGSEIGKKITKLYELKQEENRKRRKNNSE